MTPRHRREVLAAVGENPRPDAAPVVVDPRSTSAGGRVEFIDADRAGAFLDDSGRG